MFTGSTKLPPTKTPQPERLDEVYAALRRGLQWVNTSQPLFALIPVDGCQVEYQWIRRKRLLLSLKTKSDGFLLSGRTCRSTSWSSTAWVSRSEKTRGTVVWWELTSNQSHQYRLLIQHQAGCCRLQSSVRMLIWHFVMLNVCILVFFAGVFVWAGQGEFHSHLSYTDVSAGRWNCIKMEERPGFSALVCQV